MVVLFFFFQNWNKYQYCFFDRQHWRWSSSVYFSWDKEMLEQEIEKEKKNLKWSNSLDILLEAKREKKKKLALLCHTEPEGYNVNAHIFLTCQHTIWLCSQYFLGHHYFPRNLAAWYSFLLLTDWGASN